MNLEQKFEAALELIREETPEMDYYKQLDLAAERVIEDCTRVVTGIADRRYWGHVEAVNKAFYG